MPIQKLSGKNRKKKLHLAILQGWLIMVKIAGEVLFAGHPWKWSEKNQPIREQYSNYFFPSNESNYDFSLTNKSWHPIFFWHVENGHFQHLKKFEHNITIFTQVIAQNNKTRINAGKSGSWKPCLFQMLKMLIRNIPLKFGVSWCVN